MQHSIFKKSIIEKPCLQDKNLWVKFRLPIIGEIRFNPIVTFAAISLIWTFVAICANFQDKVPFDEWKSAIVDNFTWLYVGAESIWAIFAILLYFSKYSDIKLGKEEDEPEFSDPTWFMMLFSCGIGNGLFFFGVAEPIFHYTGDNRYSADHTRPDNTLAQDAITLTLYHFGIHVWTAYSLVGLVLGLVSFREGLPLTMRSCFYPLIGDRVFGWIGDLIDIVSIMTTLFGVCTNLGLGARQLNEGLHFLIHVVPSDDVTIQLIIIWCITAVATISTVSGIHAGIKRLSQICFLVGLFVMVVTLFLDDTSYLLNLYVQSIGSYFQHILKLGSHTDAFEKLGPSSGFTDRNRWVPEGVESADGPKSWMESWTLFYWGWWISWCPFVGMFLAKISKGRTIKQFLKGTLTTPFIYISLWMVIFGGAGIHQERSAARAGLCCADQSGWFLTPDMINNSIHSNVNLTEVIEPAKSLWMCQGNGCGACANQVLEAKGRTNATYGDFINEYADMADDLGSVSTDRQLARLSCHSTEQMWFDVMRSRSGIGEFLSLFSLTGIVLYFITSSDSGSLVIDCLSANGDPDPPSLQVKLRNHHLIKYSRIKMHLSLQRIFWALTEGATASGLLVAGGKEGLAALQAIGLLSGLPFIFLMCLICVAIWKALRVVGGDLDPHGPEFAISIFAPFATEPYCDIKASRTWKLFLQFAMNIFIAPYTLAVVAARLNNDKKVWAYAIPIASAFGLFILCHILELVISGMWAVAWFFFLCFVATMTSYRIQTRERYGIDGHPAEDFFVSCFYPACVLQVS